MYVKSKIISNQDYYSEKLLEVSLMRLAKHVWSSADCQGRLAVVPPSLISHLAER